MKQAAVARTWLWGGLVFAVLESLMIWVRIKTAPVAWICLVWVLFSLAAFACGRPRRALWMNLAAVLAAFGLVEGALWASMARNPYMPPAGVTLAGDFNEPHRFILMPSPGIGYRPRADASAESIRRYEGHLVYDVRYTVDANGLRVSPPSRPDAGLCVLMFGDSFAWGEGVDDSQTAAYQLGLLSGGRAAVRNFAFTGYGAHQMLWQVRSGAVRNQAGCDPAKPVLAIYQTLPNNIGRVAGLRGWDIYGPRFRLGPDGTLAYAGGFDAGDSILHDRVFVPAWLAWPLSRFELYGRIFGRDRRPDAFDRERFSAVVAASERELRTQYPHLRYVVVVWPDLGGEGPPGLGASDLIASLRRRGLDARAAGDLLPGYDASPWRSHIPNDGHPTAETHRRLAAYFLQHEPILQARAQAASWGG